MSSVGDINVARRLRRKWALRSSAVKENRSPLEAKRAAEECCGRHEPRVSAPSLHAGERWNRFVDGRIVVKMWLSVCLL